MQRKSALIETWRSGAAIGYDRVRIIGTNKKTGKLWVKAATGSRMQTRKVDSKELAQ